MGKSKLQKITALGRAIDSLNRGPQQALRHIDSLLAPDILDIKPSVFRGGLPRFIKVNLNNIVPKQKTDELIQTTDIQFVHK